MLLGLVGSALVVDLWAQSRAAIWSLAALVALISFREACALARRRGLAPAEWAGCVVLVAALLGTGWGRELHGATVFSDVLAALPPFLPFVLMGWCLMRMLAQPTRFQAADAAITVFLGLWFGLLWFAMEGEALVQQRRGHAAGTWFLGFLVAANKGSDIAAYLVGRAVGRHRMAPAVSPGKTWEGALAGLVAGAGLGAALLAQAAPDVPWWRLIGVAAGVTIASQVGDLVESAYKRWAGVKDSGALVPEFGGAFDMVDGFLVSGAAASGFVLAGWL